MLKIIKCWKQLSKSVKIDGKNTITSPSAGSPQSVGQTIDLDENVPVKDTELDFRFSRLNKGKSSTIETENLSTEAPDASKEFIHTEVFEFSAQFCQAEADWLKNFRGIQSGITEMVKSDKEVEEEDCRIKLP